ncbi:putative quinol monooxygenase, partial [Pseudomonas aeruginosa]
MNQAIRVVALLQAREGRAAEVERLLLARVQPSRGEDGCPSYVLHRSLDEPGRLVFIEHWADHDAVERHRRRQHYRAVAGAVAAPLA